MKRSQRSPTTTQMHKAAPADHVMRDALIAALNREAKKGKRTTRLQAVAEKLVELALKGDFYAVKEIFDRVDGTVARPAGEASRLR
jgi:hypothetical protein